MRIQVDVTIHAPQFDRLIPILRDIQSQLGELNMSLADNFAALTAEVQNTVTVESGAVTAIQGIEAQLTALAKSTTIAPADVASLAASLAAARQGLATAIASVPPAPAAPAAPVTPAAAPTVGASAPAAATAPAADATSPATAAPAAAPADAGNTPPAA